MLDNKPIVTITTPINHQLPTPDMAIRVDGQSRGLGDTVAKITKATGLDQLSKLYTEITGLPCGCSQRQEALNKLFPYNIKEENSDE